MFFILFTMIEVYTLKEASFKYKIAVTSLKIACEKQLLKAVKLPNNKWRISSVAMEDFLNCGSDIAAIQRHSKLIKKTKGEWPAPLRDYWQKRRNVSPIGELPPGT